MANAGKSKIGDRVWIDANGNGIQDAGEQGASGVTVALMSAGADGKFGTADDVTVGTAITNSSGNYQFTGLAAGKYQVHFGTLSDYGYTGYHAGSDNKVDSDANGNGMSQVVTLGEGKTNVSIDAGLVHHAAPPPAGTGSIGDLVWIDANGNGRQDAGEAGAAAVKVSLEDTAGHVLQTTTTDASGAYHFGSLAAGNYQVQFAAPSGFHFVTPHTTNDSDTPIDSDANANGLTQVVSLGAGKADTTIDAGIRADAATTGSIGDRVWFDWNGNGIQDDANAAAARLTVYLEDSAGHVLQTTTTNVNNGNYLFSDVAAGDYQVQVVAPAGTRFVKAHAGSDGTLDSDVDSTGHSQLFSLAAGQVNLTIDAGLEFTPTPATASALSQLVTPSNALFDLAFGSSTSLAPVQAVTVQETDGDLARSLAQAMQVHATQLAA
jgi:SdrD B-like domain